MEEELSSKRPQLQQPLSPSRESSRRPQPGLAAGTPPEPLHPTGNLIVPKAEGLKITGTFLDEISHDIPHQNWGEIFDGIHDVVDACAFQYGHLFDRYKEYFGIR